MKGRWERLLALSICGVALSHAPAYSKPVKVNAVVLGTMTDIIFYIGKEKKYFEQEGLDVYLVPIPAGSAGNLINALANGTVDVAPVPFGVNLIGLMRESGIRIVAGYSRSVKGKPTTVYCLVRKDLAGKIKTYADFKGRIIAVPSPGIWNRILLSRELDKVGLSDNDFTGKTIPIDILPSMFVNKTIDAAITPEPLASRMIDMGVAEALAGTDIANESSPNIQLCYSKRFLGNPQAGRRFMAAVLRSIRAFQRATPEELNAVAIKAWGMPVDMKVLFKLNMAADGEIDAQSLAAAQDYALSKGWLKSKIDVQDIIDPSYVRYANESLRKKD